MAMVILFRDVSKYSPFKEALFDLVSAPGDELILSSGYIRPYLARRDFILHLNRHMKNGKVRLIAGNFDSSGITHRNQFNDTYNKMANRINRLNKLGANIDLRPQIDVNMRTRTEKWHSKIALKVEAATDEVTAALIGSSNLSKNSLEESTSGFVTNECDVYIWDSKKFQSTFKNIHRYWVDSKTKDQRNAVSQVLDLSSVIPANTAVPQKVLFGHLLNKVSSFRV